MHVPYTGLPAQWQAERSELLPLIDQAMAAGQFIGGNEVTTVEQKLAERCQSRYAVALNSGTDSLILGLRALGVGYPDEVITPPNSFIASTAAIISVGARPIFVDVCDDMNIDCDQVRKAITSKTKAIMPVHLTGRMCNMTALHTISTDYGIPIIEDAAQAVGSQFNERSSGSWGAVGCFSTHPLKNLNACGDGGFLTTNDADIASQASLYRNHGLIQRDTAMLFGSVSRMDTIQAMVLNFRLQQLDDVIEARRGNADCYRTLLDPTTVSCPIDGANEFNTYHTFVIQVDDRDKLKAFLLKKGIQTAIHYPRPIHLQPAAKSLSYKFGDFPKTEKQAKRILSLPIHQYLTRDQIEYVAETINNFFQQL